MQRRRRSIHAAAPMALLAVLSTGMFVGTADADDRIRVRGHRGLLHDRVAGSIRPTGGEAARYERLLWSSYFGNTNNNVFRNSRQASADRNPFRSSRHYDQRLLASRDGFPLRTFVHAPTLTRDGTIIEAGTSFAWPRGARERNRWDYFPIVPPPGFAEALDDAAYEDLESPSAPAPEPRRRITRADIEMVPIHVNTEARAASQRAVLRREVAPDGTVRMVIASVPIEASAPGNGWNALATGKPADALAAFAADQYDADLGAVATLGTALALVQRDDVSGAARAVRRALELEPQLTERFEIDGDRHAALLRAEQALEGTTDADGLAVLGVVKALLPAAE